MLAQALAAAATLVSVMPRGNRIALELDRGAAELSWVSPNTFHFRRVLEGSLPEEVPAVENAVKFTVDEIPGAVRIQSSAIEVTIRRQGVVLRVRRADGGPLMADLSEPRVTETGMAWDREWLPGVTYYGLGPRSDPVFDLAGRTVASEYPMLVSTAGYGEFYPGAGVHRFDFTGNGLYRIESRRIDYYFYYGPTPKQIFEEHNAVRGRESRWPAAPERFGSWATLRSSLLRLVQGAMSADFAPGFDLDAYANAPPELQRRARQLGSLVPAARAGRVGWSSLRARLENFFGVYALETRDRGFPLWHPLPFEFPTDPECARHADEFMLGDELLVAPIFEPGGRRTLYLPQGTWTDLATNEVFTGKGNIEVSTEELPVFGRNGAIVPMDVENGLALHYFPRLGGEFFLLESDLAEYSQVHAAPAGRLLRLEIESRKDREYIWVVHHSGRPTAVGFQKLVYRKASSPAALEDRGWFYDAALDNLHMKVRAKAGEDLITNISF
jgi:hypothetical protein